MSDYRDIEIIVNVFGKDNIMTDEPARVVVIRLSVAVSQLVRVDEVAEEIKKMMLAIEDVSAENLNQEKASDDYVIVRTRSAGVHAGYLRSRTGQEVTLERSRRLWYWDGAASLSQLAMEGVSKPENCKFPCEVDVQHLFEVVEIIPATCRAKASIQEVRVWSE